MEIRPRGVTSWGDGTGGVIIDGCNDTSSSFRREAQPEVPERDGILSELSHTANTKLTTKETWKMYQTVTPRIYSDGRLNVVVWLLFSENQAERNVKRV